MDFDANGLYATVMRDKNSIFPNINSAVIIEKNEFEQKYLKDGVIVCPYLYIANLNMFTPNELCFIPVPTKEKEHKGSCFYWTGYTYDQTYNSIDIEEAQKVGCKILSVNSAIIFTESMSNHMENYIGQLQDKWNAIWKSDPITADLYKLNCNSFYGKTVCKDNTESYIFTTEDEFVWDYYNSDLISFQSVGP